MAWIKRVFAVVFSTEFLKKILLIASILVLINYLDRGLRIDIEIDHRISNGYTGFEIKIRDNN